MGNSTKQMTPLSTNIKKKKSQEELLQLKRHTIQLKQTNYKKMVMEKNLTGKTN